jgi:hypothetical protein
VTPCSVVVRYQRFRGPCCRHLQGEVAGMGENGIDFGPDWRGVQVPLANRKRGESDPAASASNVRREC